LSRVLVIGYGNPMRGDDGVGGHVAQTLDRHFHDDPGVRVIGSHQLTPEMAEDVAASEFVLFLDAAAGPAPGTIEIANLEPQPEGASFSHHLSPAMLLSAALELYGSAPRAQLLTIIGASFELGEALSPGIAQQMPALFNQAVAIIESSRGLTVRDTVSRAAQAPRT